MNTGFKGYYTYLRATIIPVLFLLICNVAEGQTRADSLCSKLRTAAYHGSYLPAEILLADPEIEIDCYVDDELTALGYAIQEGHLRMVNLLLSYGANPNGVQWGMTFHPLALAVMNNHLEIAEELIVFGADPDKRDLYDLTPLIRAINQDNYLMADMLIHYGADPDIGLNDGTTPLHIAALYADYLFADLLISAGASIDSTDYYGYTPLMIAAFMNDTLLGKRLLYAGAATTITNSQGRNALDFAILGASHEMIILLAPFAPERKKQTAVNLATVVSGRQTVNTLAENGFPVNRKPIFSGWQSAYSISLNGNQSFSSYRFSLRERKYNALLTAGFSHRNKAITTQYLPDGNDTMIFQMQGKRYAILAGIEKRFRLLTLYKNNLEFAAGVNYAYSRGSFRGSEKLPWGGFTPELKAAIILERKHLSAGIGYMYFNSHDNNAQPHFLSMEASLNFPFKKYNISIKKLPYALSW